MKENMEYVKTLNEQLQSKEVELLRLRTEVETQQGALCLSECITVSIYAKCCDLKSFF